MNTKVISVYSQKGGVGKSTLSTNVSYCLSKLGKKVLLIDFDAQGSASTMLNIATWKDDLPNIGTLIGEYALHGSIPSTQYILESIYRPTYNTKRKKGMQWEDTVAEFGFDLLPVAGDDLSIAELAVSNPSSYIYQHVRDSNTYDIFSMLKMVVNKICEKLDYDYIIIDSNPSLSIFGVNTLVASNYLIIPTNMDYISIIGIAGVLKRLNSFSEYLRNYEVLGVVKQMFATRRMVDAEVADMIDSRHDVDVFETEIPEEPSLAKKRILAGELLAMGTSPAAVKYMELAEEIIRKVEK